MKKLNLGCGEFKKKSYINVDINPLVKPDVLMDLSDIKSYKRFKDNEFDEILLDHILEHLPNPFEVMKELNRILKSSGKLIIRVPHFSRGFSHAQHKCSFDVSFPLYFNKKFKGGYYGINFKLLKMKMTWMIRFDLKKTAFSPILLFPLKILNFIINGLANLNPYFCSRIWCFYVGGFEEIEFIFQK